MYQHEHGRVMSTSAIAAMLSTILYYRRFFPYYTYNVIGGLDDQGSMQLSFRQYIQWPNKNHTFMGCCIFAAIIDIVERFYVYIQTVSGTIN